jgi:hypothetical protein
VANWAQPRADLNIQTNKQTKWDRISRKSGLRSDLV